MRHAQVCLGEIPLRLKMRKAHSADVVELETHQPDASAANQALERLGREVNLFAEKKEVGKPGDFDHTGDEELTEFIEAQGEVVRELERQPLTPPAPKQRKGGYQALGKCRSRSLNTAFSGDRGTDLVRLVAHAT